MPGQHRVAIVEDDAIIAKYYQLVCESLGKEVVGTAESAQAAVALIRDTVPDFVIMDMRLKGNGDGVDVALQVFEEMPDTKIVYATGSNEPPTIARINKDHPYRILIKPVGPEDLEDAFVI